IVHKPPLNNPIISSIENELRQQVSEGKAKLPSFQPKLAIVQMPLDSVHSIDNHRVTDAVSPDKDVDGLNTVNEGRIACGDFSGFVPCTPAGCVELIKRTGVPIAGKNVVVLGRSRIVGTPVSELLKWEHATV
ncbi:C-1-tetrahydrofolate synthase, partial [Operophtera brumata]